MKNNMKTSKISILFLYFFIGVACVHAQLNIDVNGKVGIGGSKTNNGWLHINKDGSKNGLSIGDSLNYASYPFRFFRKGAVGYIARYDTLYNNLRMNYNGQIATGTTGNHNAFGCQISAYSVNSPAFGAWYRNVGNNFADGLKSSVEEPSNCTFAGWYTPVGGTAQKNFMVTGAGNVYYMGELIFMSDSTVKSDIKIIEKPLSIIKKLNGVSYNNDYRANIKKIYQKNLSKMDKTTLDKDSTYDNTFSDKLMNEYDKRNMGLIAQEVEKVLPDIVYNIDANKKGIAYNQLIALLIEGIKEQQKEIDTLNETVSLIQGISKAESSKMTASLPNIANSDASVLYQNTPNPFTTQTQISYFLSTTATDAQLCIYNLNGQQLRSFKLTERGAGTVTFQANDLQAGIYLYSLLVDGKEIACKKKILTE